MFIFKLEVGRFVFRLRSSVFQAQRLPETKLQIKFQNNPILLSANCETAQK